MNQRNYGLRRQEILRRRWKMIGVQAVLVLVAGALLMVALMGKAPAQQQQQRTVYDASGKVQSRVATDSQGSTTAYGPDGKVQFKTSTDSQGTTTIYGADGRKSGSVRK